MDGTVYVSDYNRNAVFAVAPTGAVARVVGLDNFDSLPASGGGGPAAQARTYGISGLAAFNGSSTIGQAPFELRRVVNGTISTLTSPLSTDPPAGNVIVYRVLERTAAGEPLLQKLPGDRKTPFGRQSRDPRQYWLQRPSSRRIGTWRVPRLARRCRHECNR